MTYVYATAYVVVALFVGLCGRHRRMGFVGSLIMALLMTPPLGLLLLYLTREEPRRPVAPDPR